MIESRRISASEPEAAASAAPQTGEPDAAEAQNGLVAATELTGTPAGVRDPAADQPKGAESPPPAQASVDEAPDPGATTAIPDPDDLPPVDTPPGGYL